MLESFDTDALLGHIYSLDGGIPVRLRLARGSDAAAIRELLAAHGRAVDEVELARLVHFDPRRRYVLCAAGLVGSTETVLGVGAITLHRGSVPDLLLVGDGSPAAVADLLRQALIAAAERHRPARAA